MTLILNLKLCRFFLFFLFIILGTSNSYTQFYSQRIKFETISLEQNLSQSTVRAIYRDSHGFMWFGTEDGLNKYDGYNFTVYRINPDDSTSLGGNFIRIIHEDKNGFIWIGTNGGGLSRFDRVTDKFTRFQNIPADSNSLSNNFVWAFHEDKTGNFWIGTDGGGLNKLVFLVDNQHIPQPVFKHYRNNPNDPTSISHNNILSICEDSTGELLLGTRGGGLNIFDPITETFVCYQNENNDPRSLGHNIVTNVYFDHSNKLWVGTLGGGLNLFDPKNNNFVRYQSEPRNPFSLSDNRIWAILEDQQGNLWVGTDGGGLNRYDQDSDEFFRFKFDENDPTSISNDHIFSLYEDKSGVLWIGTEFGGVNKIDKYKEKFIHYKNKSDTINSLNDNSTWAFYQDKIGYIWIGTRDGGLNKFDRKNIRFSHYLYNPNNPFTLRHNHVRTIFEDKNETLWIGTDGGGLHQFNRNTNRFINYQLNPDNPTSISGNRIYSILEDHTGILWIGTRTGGLNKFDRKTGQFFQFRPDPDDSSSISDNFVYKLFEDRSGTLWVGTFTGGLNKFNRETETFTHYRSNHTNKNSISHDNILTIFEDNSGFIWIGSGGGGMDKFNPQTGLFTNYRETQGLSNNFVYGILEDKKGNLWISTNLGLSRFNSTTETFKNYTVQDGLQSNEFNGGAYYKSEAGEMFFGGINGFNSFFPEKVQNNENIPPIYVVDFLLYNKPVGIGDNSPLKKHISETKEIILNNKQNDFSFEFAALNYTIPEKNQYKYMLENFNDDWIYTNAENRVVSYMNLSPGDYIFRVKGSNNDGIWNSKGTAINVIIKPPFWGTWWFQILVLLGLIGLIFVGYRSRLKNERLKIELQAAHDAQMFIMPHKDPLVDGLDISGVCFPAHEVGGDFFDYFWLDQDKTKFVVAVGDVSGKAMTSAMTAVLTSGMLNLNNERNLQAKELLTRLNNPMFRKTSSKMFTGLCLLEFEIQNRKCILANAGMNEPILKNRSGINYIKSTGPKFPLGLTKNVTYEQKIINVDSDDVLILFTDGISDSQNKNNEFYGYQRIVALLQRLETSSLSAQQIKQNIIDDVNQFSSGSEQFDDMTVVVVKIS